MRRRLRDLRQPRPWGPDRRQWPQHLGGQRQPPQGRGAERSADRRAARPPALAEGCMTSTGAGSSAPGILYISYDGMLEPLGQSQVVAYLEMLAPGRRIHLISFEKP